ncbi:MAG: uracil-DNA glycosylase [Gammaproteobacteria bacterium]
MTKASASSTYDPDCRRCPRLAAFLDDLQISHSDYWNAPVPAFGDPDARLLIVGLAPGMHGANASGRPFTGDFAGILLYQTLFDLGLSSAPQSVTADDDLRLQGCRITNAVKCLPPQNKPTTMEVSTCNSYLAKELDALPRGGVLLALGGIAHRAILRALGRKQSELKFGHGLVHKLPNEATLVDSYHCSRYNTQTRRLTPEMFRDAVARAKEIAYGSE